MTHCTFLAESLDLETPVSQSLYGIAVLDFRAIQFAAFPSP